MNVGAGGGVLRATARIANQKGLHARAAASFVKVAEAFDADIKVSANGQTVPGTSIMGLLMLGAALGTTIEIAASGSDARAALDALVRLVDDRFAEEDPD